MNEYQIGKDIQNLQAQIELLKNNSKKESCSRPLKEDELSDEQIKNIDLLSKHYTEIVSNLNKVLEGFGIDLYLSSFSLQSNKKQAAVAMRRGYPCCCSSGWYVSDCSMCSWLPRIEE